MNEWKSPRPNGSVGVNGLNVKERLDFSCALFTPGGDLVVNAPHIPVHLGAMGDALTWAGTFHGIGARILHEYAEQIGISPAFTIHDREDAADLMNLVRHQLGFSKTESRFPTKSTCLQIYSRAVNGDPRTVGS